MHILCSAWIVVVALGACSRSSSTEPSRSSGSAAPRTALTKPPSAQPSPPDGVIVPAIGHIRSVAAGDNTTAYVWKAIYEASEPDIKDRRATVADSLTSNMDTGDIASVLYAAQVRAAGIEVSSMGAGFSYMIQGGSLAVIVRPDDDFHKGDPSGFTISVGVAGG